MRKHERMEEKTSRKQGKRKRQSDEELKKTGGGGKDKANKGKRFFLPGSVFVSSRIISSEIF